MSRQFRKESSKPHMLTGYRPRGSYARELAMHLGLVQCWLNPRPQKLVGWGIEIARISATLNTAATSASVFPSSASSRVPPNPRRTIRTTNGRTHLIHLNRQSIEFYLLGVNRKFSLPLVMMIHIWRHCIHWSTWWWKLTQS